MPRQLPWLAKGSRAGPRTQVKAASTNPGKRLRSDLESDDDDFFAGTVLESKGKGKEKANFFESDDELPELPNKSFRRPHAKQQADRALSSSPPPAVSELPQPKIESMRKCINRFDLRDDEWMMVEDEFLQTAKLFTRHLHLAEYERLKAIVQTKKEIARPIVASSKPSAELQMKTKAEKQVRSQNTALKNALSSSGKGGLADLLAPPKRSVSESTTSSFSESSHPPTKTASKQLIAPSEASDSEDLDAPPRPSQAKRAASLTPFAKPLLPSTARVSTYKSTRKTTSSFDDGYPSKASSTPGRPSQTSTVRNSRRTALSFDDGYPAKSSPITHRPNDSSSSTRMPPPATPRHRASRSTTSLIDDDEDRPQRTPVSRENADRLAKRKAERKNEKQKEAERKKSIDLDDIPTFLF